MTVKDITELADINRVTFYRHYLDIYDLYDRTEQEILVEIGELVLHLVTFDHVVFKVDVSSVPVRVNVAELAVRLVSAVLRQKVELRTHVLERQIFEERDVDRVVRSVLVVLREFDVPERVLERAAVGNVRVLEVGVGRSGAVDLRARVLGHHEVAAVVIIRHSLAASHGGKLRVRVPADAAVSSEVREQEAVLAEHAVKAYAVRLADACREMVVGHEELDRRKLLQLEFAPVHI